MTFSCHTVTFTPRRSYMAWAGVMWKRTDGLVNNNNIVETLMDEK